MIVPHVFASSSTWDTFSFILYKILEYFLMYNMKWNWLGASAYSCQVAFCNYLYFVFAIFFTSSLSSRKSASWINGITKLIGADFYRFVRFVNTPEVLERVYTIESEIFQIEEAIAIQGNNDMGIITVSEYYQNFWSLCQESWCFFF